MGRPLNKKYFGNRNTGSASVTTDNGIGGGAVAGVTLNALGDYTTRPTITFAVPTIPGGVRATGTITSEASTVAPDGTLLDGVNYVVGDLVTFDGVTGTVGRVATVGSGQGEIQTIDFVGTGTNRGSFTTLPTNKTTLAVTVVGNTIGGAGSTGTGQTVAITFRANEVVITEAGSGYTAAPTPTFTESVSATSVEMLVDSGAPGTTGNQENAIVIYANTADAGAKIGDVRKQKGSRRYQVRTADGIATCKLVADDTPAVGEAYITATDQGGATYWVTKLTSHRATIVPKGDGSPQFPLVSGDPQHVGWTFGTAIAPSTGVLGKVTIQNA